ncbi:polysaccharide deacetylase family protein [Natranaerobius trueperi]|uniref:NodB homology domain-containing protein n=1 Tax=Natranaerobius trueperi TaxID=759412 RepID=A0A226C127_9FIRM|nr:polysaccharide deacetylase family protein [Natranaerobius trueperi]OWZ84895.1 hypothetical protein CDO51_00365 [Natranaerobius trueperi]
MNHTKVLLSLFISIILGFLIIMPSNTVAMDKTIKQTQIVVDDTLVPIPGRIINGRTMVPLRGVFEEVGANVSWDSETELITIHKEWDLIKLTPGSNIAEKNYDDHELENPPKISRGTTWLPLRDLMELFELDVDWVSEYNLVRITTGDEEKSIDKIGESLEPLPETSNDQIVYLTFDDGPSNLTPQVLDLLDQYDAEATFFVIGRAAKNNPHILQRIHNEGHRIGNHSYTHDYDKVYDSPESFEEELIKTEEIIKDIIGKETTIFRPPGGSYPHLTDEMREVLNEHGYKVYNWSVSSGDTAIPTPKPQTIKHNVLEGVNTRQDPIVLLHDSPGSHNTIKALPKVLHELSFDGYNFKAIP